MKYTTLIIGILFMFNLNASSQNGAEDEEWIPLFNGKDLTGWTPKIRYEEYGVNFGNTFRVEDGVMQVGYEKYDEFNEKFGHIFYETPFSHYIIRVEYRFVGEQAPGGPGWALRNSGIMLHCQDPATMTKDQDFPVSVEVQLLGGNGEDPRTTANMCSPGTHIVMDGELIKQHCVSSNSKTYHGVQWVTAEVEVHGGEVIKHFINGELVMHYEKPQLDPGNQYAKPLVKNGDTRLSEGYISLQSESHPVEFRKVELLPLDE